MKKFLCLLLVVCVMLTSACLAVAEPVTVTDQAGRTVTLEKCPERIVSGYYISTSAMIALGLKDKLVGIEAKAKSRPVYKFSAPELIDLPNVGTAKQFDLEGCIALNPDLVVLPLKLKSVVESLENLGINVLLVNPEDGDLLREMMDMLGIATGTEERLAQMKAFTGEQEEKLATLCEEKPSVYLAGNSALLSTAGEKMYQSTMINLAGGVNVAAELEDTYWAEISYEQLLAWDPAYIVLASDAAYTVEDVMQDPNLAECTAVKKGNVVQMPAKAESWDSPVPGTILGSLWLASVLHENEITADEVMAAADVFYGDFYGFVYSEK